MKFIFTILSYPDTLEDGRDYILYLSAFYSGHLLFITILFYGENTNSKFEGLQLFAVRLKQPGCPFIIYFNI